MNRFTEWLPDRVDARIRVFAWISFVLNVLIIATGGAVRLTGSGLGCSDWPVCELVCSYERWVDSTSRLLATLGEADRERIYSGTARETYGI